MESCYFMGQNHAIINYNKTAGQHPHIFRPSTLLKMPFKRKKRFFPKNALQQFFLKFKNFLIFAQTLNFGENILKKYHFIWHSTAKVSPFPDFEKKHQVVLKKTQLYYLRNLTSPVGFYGKYATIR